MLLFNGQPQGGNPTLQVFTRVQASNPEQDHLREPGEQHQGNATILLTGVYKPTTGLYSKILDVQHITQSATFPLTSYKTTVKKGNYASAKCAAADHTVAHEGRLDLQQQHHERPSRRPSSARSASDELAEPALEGGQRGAAVAAPLASPGLNSG